LAIDPQTPATLYAGTNRYNGFNGGSVLVKSTDGGGSWSAVNTGLPNYPYYPDHPYYPVTGVYPLAIDPHAPTTLYAGTDGGGVYKSTYGGESWSANGLNAEVLVLAIDPLTPTTLYAATGYGAVKSIDGGVSWTQVNGISAVFVVAIDPLTPTTLYVGTSYGV